MTVSIAIVLLLLVLAVVLFSLETISVDLVTLLLLIALVVTGILKPDEAFAGLSSGIIIVLASIFVLNGALQETGVIDAIGARLLRIATGSAARLTFVIMTAAGAISAFTNNTTVTALFLAPVVGLARKLKVSPSRLLLPLSYASILGGTCTLIGTSTNMAVSGYMAQHGMKPLGMFELTPIGLAILGTGITYMMLVGRRLLPDNPDQELSSAAALREYLSEIVVMTGSQLEGQLVFESDLAKLGFRILKVIRGDQNFSPNSKSRIAAQDILLVEGQVADLMKVKAASGIEIRPEVKLGDLTASLDDLKIAEVLITPHSDLIRRTLKESDFRNRFGLTVLAVSRHGKTLREKMGDLRLRVGDMLLVQGSTERFNYLKRSPDLVLFEELNPGLYRSKKGLQAGLLFGTAMVVASFGWLPLPIAFLSAALLAIFTRTISIEKAYEYIDWRLLILIGGMTAFGTAMTKTGAAEYLAGLIVHWCAPLGVVGIMAGFCVLTILLTQPMSNAAAALVVLPVALASAERLGVNERTFAIAIMLAASVSFITPFEPSCVLVYGPGQYKFRDFLKVGAGLTLLLLVVVFLLLPMLWPLYK